MTDTATVIDQYNAAFLERAPEKLVDIIADDCVMEGTGPAPDGNVWTGYDECLAGWQGLATDDMGAWTVSHALADGIATAGGGVLHDLALNVASTDIASTTVFAIEAVGLALCVPMLRGINVDTFAKDVAAASARRSAQALGWAVPSTPAD